MMKIMECCHMRRFYGWLMEMGVAFLNAAKIVSRIDV
jgi:hypothetical protein